MNSFDEGSIRRLAYELTCKHIGGALTGRIFTSVISVNNVPLLEAILTGMLTWNSFDCYCSTIMPTQEYTKL